MTPTTEPTGPQPTATVARSKRQPGSSNPAAGLAKLAGRAWGRRIAWMAEVCGSRTAREAGERHAIERALERHRTGAPTSGGEPILALAADALALRRDLGAEGRDRLDAMLANGLAPGGTLVPLFHLLRTARLQRDRGFVVAWSGLEQGSAFDLLLRREGREAELASVVLSAEEGRDMHRSAWAMLADRVDPELQTWLAAHPGRYLLKMTLPNGLRSEVDADLAALHGRISALLREHRRADHDEAAVLRLDPLLLAGAQSAELGLGSRLRQEFGPEAHLSVTTSGRGIFVMAARAGRPTEVATAVRRCLTQVAPTRLSGERPGLVSMFLEDAGPTEWRRLRDDLTLEGEVRQFLTQREADRVVAIACASRAELFGARPPLAAPEGELRFRNQRHKAARDPALAPSVSSTN